VSWMNILAGVIKAEAQSNGPVGDRYLQAHTL
jgi:hypothetical protein